MPRPYPKEFCDDVVRVACGAEAPLKQITNDFGVSEASLHNRMRAADIEDGVRPGLSAEEAAELSVVRRRNRVLGQENEILHRAAAFFSRDISPI